MVIAPLGFSRLEFSVLFLPYAFILYDGSQHSQGFPLVYAGATHLHCKLRYSHRCLMMNMKSREGFWSFQYLLFLTDSL
jgi:hypothetical protein